MINTKKKARVDFQTKRKLELLTSLFLAEEEETVKSIRRNNQARKRTEPVPRALPWMVVPLDEGKSKT